MDMKGKPFPQNTDHDWMCDFAFLVDTIQCLKELNSNLERINQLINEMFAKKKRVFDNNLWLWEIQYRSNNVVHFPTLGTEKPTDKRKYAEEIQI
jgi:hypothetical protein